MKSIVLCLGLLVGSLAAEAGVLRVTGTGEFGPSTSQTAWTSAGKSWKLSFLTDSEPQVVHSTTADFEVVGTNFTYLVGDTPVSVPAAVILFPVVDPSELAYGLLNVVFLSDMPSGVQSVRLAISGDRAFQGTTANPVLTPGTYTSTGGYAEIDGIGDGALLNTTVVIEPVPEPGTAALGAGALILACTLRLRKMRERIVNRICALRPYSQSRQLP